MSKTDPALMCEHCGQELKVRRQAYEYTELAGLSPKEYTVLVEGIDLYECACGLAPEIPNVEGLHYAIGTALITDESPIRSSGFVFLRKTLGMTQARFSKWVGITSEYLSEIENGRRPSLAQETVIRLRFFAELLGKPDLEDRFRLPFVREVVGRLTATADRLVEDLEAEKIEIESPPAWMIKRMPRQPGLEAH